jgi:T5SS/PEP-CTERM-associated repeat protein
MITLSSSRTWRIHRAVFVVLITLVAAIESFGAVTGTGDFSPNPPVENATVQVGNNGYGTFRVDGGTTFTSSFVGIGGGTNGFGRATVTDEGSIWTMSGASIGQSGVGQLEVRNGGVAIIGSTVGLGSSSGSGEITVTGAGSLLQLNSQLNFGDSGTARLTIADEATINVPNGQTRIGVAGQLHLDGGLLRTDYLESRGVISGGGEIEVTCCGSNFNYGRIQVGLGDHLLYRSYPSGTAMNIGELLIHGGELEFQPRLQNNDQGEQRGLIELSHGVLRTGIVGSQFGEPMLTNRGLVAAIEGENHVYGTVRNENQGDIVVTNNSLLMFHHNVVGYFNSTISVSAGSTAIFLQDLEMNGGTLLADLTGATGFGHVEVIGDFQFSGNLAVNLVDDYQPELGDTFPLAKVSGAITGTPNLEQLPYLAANLAWDVTTDNHEVVLSVIAAPPLPGDFDSDGDVDGRDFLAWQRDPSVGSLADWESNYGSSAGSIGAVSVPEPGCIGLVATCFGVICMTKQTRRS